jgi:MFS family permease
MTGHQSKMQAAASSLFRPSFPFRPSGFPFYYGWVVLVASTIGLVMSAPGQTIGVSVFTEPLLKQTGLSRLQFSNAYLLGTLTSGLMLPAAGRLLDRIGVRRGVVYASLALGATLAALSQLAGLTEIATNLGAASATAAYVILTVGFVGLRFTGQGVLTLACRTMLGRWFERRRGLVSSISAPFATLSFASSPLLLSGWVEKSGWSGAWLEMALAIGLGMTLFGWLFFRETPEESGLEIDGGRATPQENPARRDPNSPNQTSIPDATRREALRSPTFWLVTLAVANHAMVGTGISLHIVDLGAAAGLSEAQSLRVFLPVTLISVPTGIALGLAVDRCAIRPLIQAMMVGQLLMFGLAPHLGSPPLYALCLAGWGFSGGFYGPLTVAALPNLFGRAHLGAIQGVMMMVIVIASALGPALLAGAQSLFGSYETGLHLLAALPCMLFVVAAFGSDPTERP